MAAERYFFDVDEKKDAASKWLIGARGPTHRSETFHGVACLLAQRITAHLESERDGGVKSGVEVEGDVLLLSVIDPERRRYFQRAMRGGAHLRDPRVE